MGLHVPSELETTDLDVGTYNIEVEKLLTELHRFSLLLDGIQMQLL